MADDIVSISVEDLAALSFIFGHSSFPVLQEDERVEMSYYELGGDRLKDGFVVSFNRLNEIETQLKEGQYGKPLKSVKPVDLIRVLTGDHSITKSFVFKLKNG